jgi:hypothetical protein
MNMTSLHSAVLQKMWKAEESCWPSHYEQGQMNHLLRSLLQDANESTFSNTQALNSHSHKSICEWRSLGERPQP